VLLQSISPACVLAVVLEQAQEVTAIRVQHCFEVDFDGALDGGISQEGVDCGCCCHPAGMTLFLYSDCPSAVAILVTRWKGILSQLVAQGLVEVSTTSCDECCASHAVVVVSSVGSEV
jgi:hypothetical protein